MTDLTIVNMQMCNSINGPVDITIASQSDDGKTYEVRDLFTERAAPSCTCPAFKYSKSQPGYCKHIREAEQMVCSWHEQGGEEAQTDDQRDRGICPRCGGPTVIVRVAV